MKIPLAILGIVLAAALVVSATMAAGLIDSQSTQPKDKNLALSPSGKPRIVPMAMGDPLRIKGTGFAPGEHVRVTATAGSKKATRTATAGQRGGFVVTLPVSAVDRCNGLLVVAKGDKGSRTSFHFAQLLCAVGGAKG